MTLIFPLFLFCIALQAAYGLWLIWKGNNNTLNDGLEITPTPLSILICARNEAQNLAQNLPLILAQNHPNFEVIVVNDASTDQSIGILNEIKNQHPNLKIVSISETEDRTLPGKKYALSKAVAIAKNENLLLCDADCAPSSKEWATLMTQNLRKNVEIIAGYGAYKKTKHWLNVFIRWETLHSFVQYNCYAKSGIPYMAVGRNLACKKHLLEKAQQHPLWSSTPSGDDDILIRLMGNNQNVAIESNPKSFTYSPAKENFNEWVLQKQRHLSTGKLYKKHIQALLSIYGLSHGMMWLLAILLWANNDAYLISSMLLLRCLLYWGIWASHAWQLREKDLIFFLPFCDFGWAIYNLLLSPYIFFKTQKKWK